LRIKAHCDGPIVLLIDGHASHITPRVVAHAGSRRIILIRVVAHSSHISQPLDLCVFSLFKILYNKEQKIQTEMRTIEDMSWHSGLLSGYDNSNGEMDFPLGRISPSSRKSSCSHDRDVT
jgi:hypothetical protein